MINIQEVIIHLEKKITEYRYQQKRTRKARTTITTATQQLTALQTQLRLEFTQMLNRYRAEMAEQMTAAAQMLIDTVQGIRQQHQEQVILMVRDIQHKNQIISAMHKEFEDLQELFNIQSHLADRTQQTSILTEPINQTEIQRQPLIERSPEGRTFGGLQMIEEETERTLQSSARSQEERHITDAFIRIEEQMQEQPSFYRQPLPEFTYEPSSQEHSAVSRSQCSPSDWPEGAVSKLQQLMELSHFSQRQHSHEEAFPPQFQSLPMSLEGDEPGHCYTWQGEKLMRDISNAQESHCHSEQERQSKSKMFLEQFRRTFNKCLTNQPSRKHSKEEKEESQSRVGREEGDSQKLISQMLKEMDNNNKFNVGTRKNELRYEGGRRGGAREGQGTLYYSNGLSYEGEFKNNQRHGFGVLRFNQIEVYRGEWQADELSGQGKLRNVAAVNRRKSQAGGSLLGKWVSYCGYFRNNRFEGQGTLYLQGGQKFLGRFICGSACGEGTLYRKNGQVQTGIWRNNQLFQAF